jgi:hypothetical protein
LHLEITCSSSGRRAHSDGLRVFVRIREVPLKLDGLCDEKRGVYAVRSKRAVAWEYEYGFTLPELLTTLAILEGGPAVTKQLVGDLRRSHAGATNQLRDWRGVLALDRTEQEEGPHYYLIRQVDPYDPGGPRPAVCGQVNGRTRTLTTQVALGDRMW